MTPKTVRTWCPSVSEPTLRLVYPALAFGHQLTQLTHENTFVFETICTPFDCLAGNSRQVNVAREFAGNEHTLQT